MISRSFVNGCFDVLHIGHIRLLKQAALMGELTVAINADEIVKDLKGPKRPINNFMERAEMLYALKWVSSVVVFDDHTPTKLLEHFYELGIGPNYVVKGNEYEAFEKLPEEDVIFKNGGKIVYVEMTEHSTTGVLGCR